MNIKKTFLSFCLCRHSRIRNVKLFKFPPGKVLPRILLHWTPKTLRCSWLFFNHISLETFFQMIKYMPKILFGIYVSFYQLCASVDTSNEYFIPFNLMQMFRWQSAMLMSHRVRIRERERVCVGTYNQRCTVHRK